MTQPRQLLAFLFLLAFAGCGKAPSSDSRAKDSTVISPTVAQTPSVSPVPTQTAPKFDACVLITKEEIEAVQGSPITEVKSNESSDGEFRVSHCFYNAKEYSRSVSLAVTQSNPDRPGKRTPKDFWKETFGRFSGDEAERDKKESGEKREKESEERSAPPKKIDGIGDEAFWTGNRVGGVLYVLKKDVYLRISLGGADTPETRINKSKALAEKALGRL
jgi:hypothetical protein